MRLGQLARQLGVSPKEILRKLENDFKTEIKAHPNAKVPDEFLEDLTKAFSPQEEEIIVIEEVNKTTEPELIVEEIEIKEEVKTVHSLDSDDITEVLGKIETEIPTLNGPKIIGKIDIPEIELIRINKEAVVEIILGFSALSKKSIGLRKVPPPIPITPDTKPSTHPIQKDKNEFNFLIFKFFSS